MTCVSEQGKNGLLWTVFEGEPFCSRRIASFATDSDAGEYLLLKQGHAGTMVEVRTIENLRAERDACAKERDVQCTLKQTCIAELETLRAREVALMAVARAAKQQASRLSANTLIELKDALTTAIQSGVKLEGV